MLEANEHDAKLRRPYPPNMLRADSGLNGFIVSLESRSAEVISGKRLREIPNPLLKEA
jgi:hypothetical protein